MNIILSGPSRCGKSELAASIIRNLRFSNKNLLIGGVLTKPIMVKGIVMGHSCVDLMTGEEAIFAWDTNFMKVSKTNSVDFERWTILEEGMIFGERAILKAYVCSADLIVIDEIGHLELSDICYRAAFERVLEMDCHKIIIVRKSVVSNVEQLFRDKPYKIFELQNEQENNIIDDSIAEKIMRICA